MEARGKIYNRDDGDVVVTEVQNLYFKKYKKEKSGGIEDETAVVQELNGNYNNNSYMEKNHINLSLEVDSKLTSQMEANGIDDEMDEISDYVMVLCQDLVQIKMRSSAC